MSQRNAMVETTLTPLVMTAFFELTEPKMASLSDAEIGERVARGESVPGVIEE